ncbi:protein mono-ADP-ribosyltransferase PARP14-like isoform X5 [Haliotis rubra]|uniref:protein mono-ADP-ribosyltransferase PARP14-like isoform X5 n=1 Tax=Haliotis rubra TaxID=36100 RepID=UPI001EE5D2CC|nr:protein mono-ADP-ribosyltransferase PARP14-like isoform X5 [Haliotis rubra]
MRSGGGPVVNVIYREDGTAMVDFEEAEDVEGVLKKATHTISGAVIQVRRYTPERRQSEVSTPCDDAPAVLPDTIIVTGCGDISDDVLDMYFESKKKSGGGEVKSIERTEEGGSEVLVTFEDPKDVNRVLKKGSHKVQSMDVKVALYKPRPPTPPPVVSTDTIVVTGCGDIGDDVLEMYFESKKKSGGGDVKSIGRRNESGSEVVLVTFEDPEDLKRVLKKGSHKVQSTDIKVALYKPRPPTPPPVVSTDTIIVTGCGEISDDVLDMYFENKKKSGGGDVKSIERTEEGGSEVLVTFEDPEDMQAVLQRSHQIQGLPLQVSPYTLPSWSSRRRTQAEDSYLSAEDEGQDDSDDDEDVFVLLVEGLSDTLGEETLLFYFENRRRSGGGEVDVVEIDRDSATALVHFKEGDVVKRVLQKAPHLLENKKIEVSEYLPSKQPGLVTIETILKGKKIGTVVKVEKFGSKTSDDVLTMYFENKKRSGASEVKEIIPDKEENAKYIVFESPEEAEAVAKRSHTVDGHKLMVSLYRPPTPPPPRPRYRDKFLITGLREKTTKKTLMKFLQQKLACHPKDVMYGEEPGTVLVNIDQQKGPLKLKKMQRVCKKHPLDGAFLELSAVPISNCIRVNGITAKTSADTLTFYFESKKSGNTIECDVEKVDIVEEPRHAIVFFTNHTVIPEILGRSHKLEKTALSVSLYTECLGSGGGRSDPTWFKLPPPIPVQNVDSYKMKFIRDSSPNMKNLQKQLQDGYTDLKFESDGSWTLECCLTKDVPDVRKIAKSWLKGATEDLEHFLSLLITEKVNVLQEVWDDVITEVQKMKMPRKDAATIYIFDESHLIVVVGHKLLAENLSKQVKEVVATVEGDHERKKKEITESVANLKSWQLRLLLALGFPSEMMKKYEHLKVEICVKKNVMTLTGLMSVVKSAKVDMYETTTNFKDTSLSNLSDAQMMLVQKTDVRKYIEKKLNLKHLVGVWEADNGKLKVYGRTDAEVTDVSHIVRQSVVQQLINLDPESVPLLDSTEWKRINDDQTQNRGDMVKIIIAVDKSHIVIAATDELVAGVAEEVNNFLKENTVYSDTVQFPKGIQRFMTMHLDGEIRQLSSTFQAHSVQIIFQKSSQDFTVKGTKVGLRICMSKLEEISRRVMHTSHLFGKPGICKLILSKKGDQHIRNIEENGRCVIERNFDDQVQPIYGKKGEQRNMRSGGGIQTLATCDLGAGRTLSVCQGDITRMKVDVIVNAANQQLAHIGGLAKAIVDKGGLSIQVESDKIRQSQGDIRVGDVAVTSPGNLPCKLVVHAVGPIWSGGTNDEQGLLQEAIFNSLEKADSCGLSSIAIPALSTGIYRYPVAAATKNIIEAIQLHFTDTPGSQVMNVYVCDNNASTVQDFMQAVKQRFAADAVTVGNQDGSVQGGVVEDRHVPVNRGRPRKGQNYVMGGSTEKTEQFTRPKEQPANAITLYFFSDSMDHIDQAKSMLEDQYQNSTMTRPIFDEALKTMTKQQEAKIQDLAAKFSISVDYNRSTGRVKLHGLTNDVITAMEAVHKIVQEALRQEQQSEKAEMLSSYVQWSYIEVDNTGSSQPVEYDKIINQQIEEAYQNKKSLMRLPPDTGGDVYIVDLDNMEEYHSDFPSDKVSVIRKDLIKGASFEPPSKWTQMTTESEMVTLNNTAQEYTDVQQKFHSSLGRIANILKIERVQTKFLWQQYVAKKQQLDSQNTGHQNETVLWHGTAVDAIPSICRGGFNRSYCGKNATALGEGVYFAVQAAYSDRNTYSVPDGQGRKHMFQARVLTGMYCRGQSGMRVPPQRDPSKHIQFDSVVDNANGPGMYIIFNDTQAYPEYLITYQ